MTTVTDTFDDAWDKADDYEVPNDVWLGTQGADSPWQKLITPRQGINIIESTGIPMEALQKVGAAICTVPDG